MEKSWTELKLEEHEARIVRQDNEIIQLKKRVQHLYEMIATQDKRGEKHE